MAQTGKPLMIWSTGLRVMILKEEGNLKVEKLIAILLIEVD